MCNEEKIKMMKLALEEIAKFEVETGGYGYVCSQIAKKVLKQIDDRNDSKP